MLNNKLEEIKAKKYIVDDQECKINLEPTINELIQIEKYNQTFRTAGDTIKIKFEDLESYKNYLSLLLKPCNNSINKKNINFGEVNQKQALEIISDFFLSTMMNKIDIPNYLENLMNDFKESLKNLENEEKANGV